MIQIEDAIPLKAKAPAERLKHIRWLDSKDTAGRAAKLVKSSSIGDPDDGTVSQILLAVQYGIHRCKPLNAYAWTRNVIETQLVRYEPGDQYGTHTDEATIKRERSDVSFTVFLNDGYNGGELVIETPYGPSVVKLRPGAIVAYPTTMLHRVNPVISGTRYVVVGWIRSYIRSAEQRELLSDIEMARAKLFEACGKCEEFDVLTKASSNLQRMWMDD